MINSAAVEKSLVVPTLIEITERRFGVLPLRAILGVFLSLLLLSSADSSGLSRSSRITQPNVRNSSDMRTRRLSMRWLTMQIDKTIVVNDLVRFTDYQ